MRSVVWWSLGVGLLTVGSVPADEPPRRPDIVLFLADDLSWADCSLFGGQDVPTPNMERLARDGMTFTHAFVASPSCAPSRAALLTGLYPARNGAMLNHTRPRAGVKLWPAYFQGLGYEVAAIGKTAHYAQVTSYGFDYASHYTYHDDGCVEAAVGWLARRKSAKPLCLIVGTNWPHVPWPPRMALPPDAVALPPNLVDTPATRQARARYAHAVANADRDLGLVYDAARQFLRGDTLFLFSSDHGAQFPFGKWNNYDAGLRTPLIVAWPGRIKPGSRADALVSWVDILPTCLDAAGGPAPPDVSGRSFLGVLQGEAARHRDQVFASHSGDGSVNQYPIRSVRTRDWKYIRNLDPTAEHHTHIDQAADGDGRGYFQSWVNRARSDPAAAAIVARYHHRPVEELYDLAADPWERHNLALNPVHEATLSTLRGELDAWMKGQGDHGMATERPLRKVQAKGEAAQAQ